MQWLHRRRPPSLPVAEAPDQQDDSEDVVFACPSCGRTNLPPAGEWDPPVCAECDAALNDDAILESWR